MARSSLLLFITILSSCSSSSQSSGTPPLQIPATPRTQNAGAPPQDAPGTALEPAANTEANNGTPVEAPAIPGISILGTDGNDLSQLDVRPEALHQCRVVAVEMIIASTATRQWFSSFHYLRLCPRATQGEVVSLLRTPNGERSISLILDSSLNRAKFQAIANQNQLTSNLPLHAPEEAVAGQTSATGLELDSASALHQKLRFADEHYSIRIDLFEILPLHFQLQQRASIRTQLIRFHEQLIALGNRDRE